METNAKHDPSPFDTQPIRSGADGEENPPRSSASTLPSSGSIVQSLDAVHLAAGRGGRHSEDWTTIRWPARCPASSASPSCRCGAIQAQRTRPSSGRCSPRRCSSARPSSSPARSLPTTTALVAPSTLWGFASAGIFVLGYSMIRDMYDQKQAGTYLGVCGTMMAIGMLAGPVLGGFIMDAFSWRIVCHVIWPILLVGGLMVFFGVKATKQGGRRHGQRRWQVRRGGHHRGRRLPLGAHLGTLAWERVSCRSAARPAMPCSSWRLRP